MADESAYPRTAGRAAVSRRLAAPARRGPRAAVAVVAALAVALPLPVGPARAGGCTTSDGKLLGTDGPDDCDGTGGRDSIYGYAGGDRLRGRAGRDVVRGHAGSDRLAGGRGADRLLDGGDEGDRDVVCAGRGRDTVDVSDGDGHDQVFAQFGDDVAWDFGDAIREGGRCPF